MSTSFSSGLNSPMVASRRGASAATWDEFDALGLTWDEFDRTDWTTVGV